MSILITKIVITILMIFLYIDSFSFPTKNLPIKLPAKTIGIAMKISVNHCERIKPENIKTITLNKWIGIWQAAFVGTKLSLSKSEFKKNGAVKGPVAPTNKDKNDAIAPITKNFPLNSMVLIILGNHVKNRIAIASMIVEITAGIEIVTGIPSKDPIPAPIANNINIL